jgi:hypothetical protein
MSAPRNVIEIRSWVSDAGRESESSAREDAESAGAPPSSPRRDLVQSIHLAAAYLGLGVPSSRVW